MRSAGRSRRSRTGTWVPATNMTRAKPISARKVNVSSPGVEVAEPGPAQRHAGDELADHERQVPPPRERQERADQADQADHSEHREAHGWTLEVALRPCGPARARCGPRPGEAPARPQAGVSTSRSPSCVEVEAEHLGPAQRRLGDLGLASGPWPGRSTARRRGRPSAPPRAPPRARRGRAPTSWVVVDREPLGAGAAEQVERGARARTSAPTARPPAPVTASSTQPSACEASGGCTVRCRPKPDAVGTAPAEHRGQGGLVDLDDQPGRARHPAAYVGDVAVRAPRPAPAPAPAGRRSRRAPCRPAAARRWRPASTGRRPGP